MIKLSVQYGVLVLYCVLFTLGIPVLQGTDVIAYNQQKLLVEKQERTKKCNLSFARVNRVQSVEQRDRKLKE